MALLCQFDGCDPVSTYNELLGELDNLTLSPVLFLKKRGAFDDLIYPKLRHTQTNKLVKYICLSCRGFL